MLYGFAMTKLDLQPGNQTPMSFGTELQAQTGNGTYTLVWDGAILHGAP